MDINKRLDAEEVEVLARNVPVSRGSNTEASHHQSSDSEPDFEDPTKFDRHEEDSGRNQSSISSSALTTMSTTGLNDSVSRGSKAAVGLGKYTLFDLLLAQPRVVSFECSPYAAMYINPRLNCWIVAREGVIDYLANNAQWKV